MTCDQARQEMVTKAGGQPVAGLELHLANCEDCRREWENFDTVWRLMSIPDEQEVRPAVRARFYEALQAFEQGLEERKTGWGWMRHPVFAVALGAACLCIGLFSGMFLNRSQSDVAELKREMRGMRQLVTLSLLQQQSASERLRGVTWANQTEANDMEVFSALLRTVNSDTNENVRLGAIDAMRNFSSSPIARKGMVQALPRQNSPLVQIALIDLLADLRDPEAQKQLRSMLRRSDLDAVVKHRIERSLAGLQ